MINRVKQTLKEGKTTKWITYYVNTGRRTEVADKYIEKFKSLSTFLAAYMRDVTYPMHPNIQALNGNVKVIGRAFTVKGPDIYLNALESIPEGSIYVHANASETEGVWCGGFADLYGRQRGLVAAVIDGGINNRQETVDCDLPTFARFVSSIPAINRGEGVLQVPVTCGGVTVSPGDIILGDADGVVVIPQHNEEEIYSKMDAFLDGLGFFVSIAQREQGKVAFTKHEALSDMFRLKYEHPYDYWRYYEPWAAKWRKRYGKKD